MIKKILNILILFSFMILNSCGLGSSIKNAVTGKTKPVGDEFLVEKKNPLVLPANAFSLKLVDPSLIFTFSIPSKHLTKIFRSLDAMVFLV